MDLPPGFAVMRTNLISLLRRHSYREAPEGKPFKLASGGTSMFFVDVKQTALRAEGVSVLAPMLYDIVTAMGARAVVGVALGGCPLASSVSAWSSVLSLLGGGHSHDLIDALYVRTEAKDHGTAQRVEGPVRPSLPVVILEDVTTTGQSSLRTVEVMRQAECNVLGVVSVVDREQGAEELFQKNDLPFMALVKVSDLRSSANAS